MTDFEIIKGRKCPVCSDNMRYVRNRLCVRCNPSGKRTHPKRKRTEPYHGSPCAKCASTYRYKSGNCVACTVEYSDKHRRANITKRSLQNSLWRLMNADEIRVRNANRRARMADAVGNTTKSEIEIIHQLQNGLCAYCDSEIEHMDHKFPLIKGGTNHPSNLQGLCQFHNNSKKDKTDEEYRSCKQITKRVFNYSDLILLCLLTNGKLIYAQ